MTPPLFTLRGHAITEPTLWAIGGDVVFFTPLWAVLVVPFGFAWGMSGSWQAPLVLLVLPLAGLTWWALRRPSRVSVRVWAIGVWFTALVSYAVLVGFPLSVLTEWLGLPDWAQGGIVLAFLASTLVVSPWLARRAFLLGQGLLPQDLQSESVDTGPPTT